MKKICVSPVNCLLFLFVFIFSYSAFSQDDIILLNNDVIKGKVTEIGLNTIQYRRADNPDGPSYDLAKSNIYMIVYANGTSDVMNPLPNNNNANATTTNANNTQANNTQADNTQGDNTPAPEITTPPPPMPVYEQPYCPTPGYIWTPGYWAYSFAGYYWVPGVWVAPPSYGLLWTPGYWGFGGGFYGWHGGYWGPSVGYYGGVYYGYGYTGHGYYGGRWEGNQFQYNTAVSRVDVTVVHTTYVDNTVVKNNAVVNRSSFNGTGGVTAQATPEEQKVAAAPHIAPTPVQVSHVQAARSDKTQYASVNGGKPTVAAMNKPNGQSFGAEGRTATPSPNSQPVIHPATTTSIHTQPATGTVQEHVPAAANRQVKPTARPARHPGTRPKAAPKTYSEPSRK